MFTVNTRISILCLVLGISGSPLVALAKELDEAQRLFATHKNSVLQVRVLDRISGSKSGIGSGFFVSADGFVMTNFHVISELVYKTDRYRAEYTLNDDYTGSLTLVDVDVVHDLALLKADANQEIYFRFARRLPDQGQRLFS